MCLASEDAFRKDPLMTYCCKSASSSQGLINQLLILWNSYFMSLFLAMFFYEWKAPQTFFRNYHIPKKNLFMNLVNHVIFIQSILLS